ncbi:MAG: rhodanese-like domain-containing protein, partial [Candidatus Thermoplasmatota archaeon]|nr:rhodanese-like domain-containing protein [Candidatus Thermoplasmatota archaeon]
MDSISLENFRELQTAGVQVIDSRPTVLFSEKHIQGTIGISINGSFEYMANAIFEKAEKLILISLNERLSESFLRLEAEGFTDVVYFDISLWFEAGLDCSLVSRVAASSAPKHLEKIVDVSNSEDWEVLHVKGVSNVPLVDIVKNPSKIGQDSVLYCGNGHKSMAAVSYLLTKNIITTDITGGLSAMLVDSPDLEI